MNYPEDESTPHGDPLEPEVGDGEKSDRGLVSELVRKVAVAGLGALFMTEEGIRSLAGQLKLPKELLGLVLAQAEKTKDDIGRVISEEIRKFFQSEKLRDEFLKVLSGMTFEIKAEVSLVPRKDAAQVAGEQAPKVVVKEVTTRRRAKE